MIPIKLFAYLAEAIAPEISVALPTEIKKEDLLAIVAKTYPNYAAEIENCSVAVNQNFVQDKTISLTKTDEVALIPPVSGG